MASQLIPRTTRTPRAVVLTGSVRVRRTLARASYVLRYAHISDWRGHMTQTPMRLSTRVTLHRSWLAALALAMTAGAARADHSPHAISIADARALPLGSVVTLDGSVST